MKRLFVGRVEFEVYVMAENEDEALELVDDSAREELMNFSLTEHEVREVSDIRRVPIEWRGAIPYGGGDDRTIADVLAPSAVGLAGSDAPARDPQGASGPGA